MVERAVRLAWSSGTVTLGCCKYELSSTGWLPICLLLPSRFPQCQPLPLLVVVVVVVVVVAVALPLLQTSLFGAWFNTCLVSAHQGFPGMSSRKEGIHVNPPPNQHPPATSRLLMIRLG